MTDGRIAKLSRDAKLCTRLSLVSKVYARYITINDQVTLYSTAQTRTRVRVTEREKCVSQARIRSYAAEMTLLYTDLEEEQCARKM